jgi:hypothetical protein
MKKLLLLSIMSFGITFAQKELWGIRSDNSDNGQYGIIGKYDINGENSVLIRQFAYDANGSNPSSKLFMASNGKLYGTTLVGGTSQIPNEPPNGVLFEFDVILKKYTVLHNFISQGVIYKSDIIEPLPDILYGGNGSKIYKYNILSNTLTYLSGEGDNYIIGGLVKAANGFLYCQTFGNYCPPILNYVGSTNFGTIVKVDMDNNSIQKVYQLNCNIEEDGAGFSSTMVETFPNKLYGVCRGGGTYQLFGEQGKGTLFEFNTLTNTFTKKIDFDGTNLGSTPTDLVNNGNGVLYGVCRTGGSGINPWVPADINPRGTLFEYNIGLNTITKRADFGSNFSDDFTIPENDIVRLLKTTAGHYIGLTGIYRGPFRFDSTTNQVSSIFSNYIPMSKLTEICRKPSYQEFLPNTYATEVGTTFTFDVQNDNATTFVWKKETIVLPTQTTGILNLSSITTNDSGVYTCTMTNECGVTVTMNLNINVTNLAIDTIENYKQLISLYPNPTHEILNLKFPENRGLKAIKYKITNLLGQVIQEYDIPINYNKTELSIDTSNYPNGVFQLTLLTDKGNWNGKFVKE